MNKVPKNLDRWKMKFQNRDLQAAIEQDIFNKTAVKVSITVQTIAKAVAPTNALRTPLRRRQTA